MSAVVDRRLVDRRRQVREAWARRRLRWVVAAAVAVMLGAAGYALLDSPWLAVRTVEVSGAAQAPVGRLLEEAGVVPGVPTIRVRPGAVVAALEADPWIADAEVTVTWPGSVEVVVDEREPSAWVDAGTRWMLVAADGVVLETGRPPVGAPRVDGEVAGLVPGDLLDDAELAAAVGFLGLLPPELAVGAVGHDEIGGAVVELGVPLTVIVGDGSDLPAKASALIALIDEGIRPGSTVNVVAPTRPAVAPPAVGQQRSTIG